jgi:hypothetical protein
VKSIGNNAFDNCTALTSIDIPNSVTKIDYNAFSNCTGITTVKIGNSVTEIGNSAFNGCTLLENVTLGKELISIGSFAFKNCTSLTSIDIPSNVLYIYSSAFENCKALKYATMGDALKEISSYAFQYCTELTSITLPNSIETIYNHAFDGCKKLENVTIGESIGEISYNAFSNCAIKNVYCYATNVPKTGNSAFTNISNATLYVPESAIEKYRNANIWKNFGSIRNLEGEDVTIKQCATPVLRYSNGKLSIECETPNAEFVTKISDRDVTTHFGNEIDLTVTYNITVYATAVGMSKSETVTASLCWVDATPEMEDITDITEIKSAPVLVSSRNGSVYVNGELNGTLVNAFTTDGVSIGTATIENGEAAIATGANRGDIIIVRIGEKAMKVIVK